MASVRTTHSPARTSILELPASPKRKHLVASTLFLAALLAGCAEGGGASEQDFVPPDGSDVTVVPEAGKNDAAPDVSPDADASVDAIDAADEKTEDVALDVPADGECATGMKMCNGACVSATLPANGCGGSSCDPCQFANATAKCEAGSCAISSCNAGYSDCNDKASDGCETDIKSDPAHCNACGYKCVVPQATPNCVDGTCGVATCNDGYANCNNEHPDGCEVNLQSEAANCGVCGNKCTPEGQSACLGGQCKLNACEGQMGDCDMDPGCETDLATSLQHCGACANACSLPNAVAVCQDKTCRIASCNAGFENCDGDHANGCEINTTNNASHCGACGTQAEPTACSTHNSSSSTCKDGKCTHICDEGFADCDGPQPGGATDEGCKTPISNDVLNCGGCGVKCNNPHGSSDCLAGQCVPTCQLGWDNCNNDASDGCEASLLTSTATCGSCSTTCTNANGSTSCEQGACAPACNSGFSDCDGNPINGCETDTNTNTNHCGECNTQCLNPHGTIVCQAGVCTPGCAQGYANCDGDPIDGCETSTTIDPDNCGDCGHQCTNPNGSAACSNSACTAGCATGWGDCDPTIAGCETNTTSTTDHCGNCGKPCTNPHGSTSCEAATCTPVCDPGWDSCDSDLTDGCETSIATDANNCGGCGAKCINANGTVACANSVCTPGCKIGWKDCNGNPSDGCETDVDTSLSNCGGCGVQCTNSNGSTACVGGLCSPTCDPGYASCDKNPKNGCEIQTLIDPNNCGACGTVCTNSHGTVACSGSKCMPNCAEGWASCDGDPNDGCETSIYDVNNCGGCNNKCSAVNGFPSCATGTCKISCNAGFADCNLDPADGCEVDLSTNLGHCGQCSRACLNDHGLESCQGGACVPTCDPGWGNCDGNPVNGCETDNNTTEAHCGGCNKPCLSQNGTNDCVGGVCAPNCTTGFGNCDGIASNGCETQTTIDPNNCGGCGTTCTNAHGDVACSNSVCVPTCVNGFANCDGDPKDGCETPTSGDVNNCGGCNIKCSTSGGTPSCVSGVCGIACGAGTADCNTNAADGCETQTVTNSLHCGGCNKPCTNDHGGTSCQSSVCVPTCLSGWDSCDGEPQDGCETQTSADPNNCGGCGTRCLNDHGGVACSNSVCVPTCANGYANCDGDPKDGCETPTSGDVSNCGGCNVVCNSTNGAPSCNSGACAISCNLGFENCDNDLSNGCEKNVNADPNNCGGCNVKCTALNGANTCQGGACVPNCTAGFASCDNNPNNGCEAQVSSDPSNCGGCGTRCLNDHGGVACSNSVCVPTCSGGYANCDGDPKDGCETPTSGDIYNCGGCNVICNSTNGTPSCNSGGCAISCNSGFENCDNSLSNGCEKNVNSDPNNCGDCNVKCTALNGTNACQSGACVPDCTPGFASCDNNANNGCEAQVSSDPNNCGGCGTRCLNDHGGVACSNSVCVPTCGSGYANCDGDPKDGCETPTSGDIYNCGGCNVICNSTNGTPSCNSGSCAIACNPGSENCDNDLSNGCERNVTSDPNNCGDCNVKCLVNTGTSANTCSGSACHPTCNAFYQSCDNDPANGCEIDLRTNFNCGGCGNLCSAAPEMNQSASCSTGSCVLTCAPGYFDADPNVAGCECQRTNNGTEMCDGIDNDCNGTIDDGFNKDTDPHNCGACGIDCGVETGGMCCDGICRVNSLEHCGACDLPCAPGMLVISEIMANPSTAPEDADGEWFELFNKTSEAIDLRGFKIYDLNQPADSHTIASTTPIRVPANGYAVLGRNGNTATNGGVTVLYQYGSNWDIGQSNDEIILQAHGSVEIDRVVYTSGFAPAGRSMELSKTKLDYVLNNNTTTGSSTNYWCQATRLYFPLNYGTPGFPNDCTK